MPASARVLVVDDSPTILKVVSAILSRHGYAPDVARDGVSAIEMLRRGTKYDLVLLDFVMPRMNGYQFCRELRSDPEHKTLPVVLMSAKGDKIREQFVQQTGAVDAITKPFDSRALVAVLEGALAKTAEGRARPVPEGDTMPDEDTLADSVRPQGSGRPSRQRSSIDVAQQISSFIMPAILGISGEERVSEASIMAAVASALTGDAMATLSRTFKDLDGSDFSKEVMSGDIAAIPLAEILQVLQMQRQTGVLRIHNGQAVMTISLRLGLVDLVQSRGAADEFRLGRYFVERGLVTRTELETMLQLRGPGLLGDSLLRAGKITQHDLTEALTKQSSELIYDVLRWPFGRFSFTREPFRPEADAARLGLGISGLVLEGFRRVDEWRLMEGTIDFDQVVVIDQVTLDAVGAEKLTRTEKLVLWAVNGTRTVNEIINESAVGSFDAIKAIYQLLESRVLRTRA